ncbi:CvpA family protein [Sulfobacillus harzensis]|uniref:Colicin V synthesis protein n=1 Tax=Sulfobacillus harzensis TaxID=2729629 RepID=A0A7Y0L0B0_9FIRM|nr:CvpA family protein [Sulfobacillus harzensis]NMP20931.1 colicin V synthesis protein [Sulfobacillus harzensis]
MDWVDLVVLGYLLLGALYGLRRGLVWVGFSLAGYVVGAIVAAHMYKRVTKLVVSAAPIRHWVERYLPTPASAIPGARQEAWHLAHTLIGLLIFLLIIGALEFVGRTVGSVISQGVRAFRLTAFLNRLGGILAGIAEHGVVAGLILTLLLAVPAIDHSGLSQEIHHAPVARTLMGLFSRIAKIPGGQYL